MPSKRSAKKASAKTEAAPVAATESNSTPRVQLDALHQDPQNARSHSARNVDMIVESLERFGPARPILTDENGVILAGNATHQAAMQKGLKDARVIDVDGQTIVAVRISGLTDAEKATYGFADNRTAELATWNPARIQQLIDQGFGEQVEALWFPNELEALLKLPAPAPAAVDSDTYIPPRVVSSGVRAPALRFGSYVLDLPQEMVDKLIDALAKYQRAHGSFTGLVGKVLADYQANVAGGSNGDD